jgi:hypothetical protein
MLTLSESMPLAHATRRNPISATPSTSPGYVPPRLSTGATAVASIATSAVDGSGIETELDAELPAGAVGI